MRALVAVFLCVLVGGPASFAQSSQQIRNLGLSEILTGKFQDYLKSPQVTIPGSSRPFESASRSLRSIDPRIIGGLRIDIKDVPWQVGLIFGATPDAIRQLFCGGSQIADSWVLTAAHCVDGATASNPSSVDVISDTTYYQFGGKRTTVSAIYVHPGWNRETQENDLALLKLTSPISGHSPINLANESMNMGGKSLLVSGWGAVTEGGNVSAILLQATVPYVDNAICNKPDSYAGFIKPTMICAGQHDGGVDACQGDSGGPLVLADKSLLVGVVSFGEGCGRRLKYGVYTSVSPFRSWIDATIRDHS